MERTTPFKVDHYTDIAEQMKRLKKHDLMIDCNKVLLNWLNSCGHQNVHKEPAQSYTDVVKNLLSTGNLASFHEMRKDQTT